jgi:protein involved in polysaccharide export with SLBB domain
VGAALLGLKKENLLLQAGDKISIFRVPAANQWGKVTVAGEVKFPGEYVFKQGESIVEVLRRAGGLTSLSYLRGMKLTRRRIREQQEKLRTQIIEKEKRKLESAKKLINSSDKDSDKKEGQKLRDIEQIEDVMGKLANAELEGRLSLGLGSVSTLQDLELGSNNLNLEDGDEIEIPNKPSEVHIVGQVNFPCTVLYNDSMTVNGYLDLGGGLTEQANRSKIYILRYSGEALPIARLSGKRVSGMYVNKVRKDAGVFGGRTLMPGDTIVVPSRIRIASDRFKDTMDLIYKTAISFGAVRSIF